MAVRKVLVGYIDDDGARDALAFGQRLALAESAKLVVCSVLDYAPLPIDVEGYEQVVNEHFERLADEIAEQLGDHGFEHLRLNDASPPKALARAAEEEGADLIVLGSTHRGQLGRIFPGSVAERLFGTAPCAIAIAPRGYARRAPADLGIAAVGYDGSPESEAALDYAAGLCADLNWDLRVITVVAPVNAPVPLAAETASLQEAVRAEWQRVLDRGVERASKRVNAKGLLGDGDPALVLAGQGLDADLLVVGSRGYGPLRRVLLGSVSAELTRLAPCPVIVTPRGAEHEAD